MWPYCLRLVSVLATVTASVCMYLPRVMSCVCVWFLLLAVSALTASANSIAGQGLSYVIHHCFDHTRRL